MRATEAVRVERQIPQPAGQPCKTKIGVECPVCHLPVAKPRKTVRGELFRPHKQRLPNGRRCRHGLTERDPIGTSVVF